MAYQHRGESAEEASDCISRITSAVSAIAREREQLASGHTREQQMRSTCVDLECIYTPYPPQLHMHLLKKSRVASIVGCGQRCMLPSHD